MKKQYMKPMKNKTYDELIDKYQDQTLDQAITVDAILSIYLQESNKFGEKISLADIGIRLANNFHYLNHGEKPLGFVVPDKINEYLNYSDPDAQDTDFVPSKN